MRLSILIPAYQEEATIGEILRRVAAVDTEALGFEKEVVVCDDGSRDRTFALATAEATRDPRIRVVRHEVNRGKGAAIRTALGRRHRRLLPDPGRRPRVRGLGLPGAAR
jgi:dolichol-phosphate mannosyltransferase